jgi:hypothetical protein
MFTAPHGGTLFFYAGRDNRERWRFFTDIIAIVVLICIW